jgi:AcrR family transcriptional regulator
MKKKVYRMKRRAELEQQTRLRITKSAVALHGSLGPSRTSVSAIAEHAGVRRSTLYRHFPDELALYTACSNHWLATNPFPDLVRWAAIGDVDERLRTALIELYTYYRRAHRMLSNVLRDEETVPLIKHMLGGYRRYLSNARDILLQGRDLKRPATARVRAALGHALSFNTWRSFAIEQRLADNASVELMCLLVTVANA